MARGELRWDEEVSGRHTEKIGYAVCSPQDVAAAS